MQTLLRLFEQWAGERPTECLALSGGGSNRRYYRLLTPQRRCIATIGEDPRENKAFVAYSRHLLAAGIPVPQIYAVAPDESRYLQQDLGDTTLYSLLLDKKRSGAGFDAQMLNLYRQALTDLARIQQAGRTLDFTLAYPRSDFDRRAMLWDLNYFKYYFLKLTHLPFDEDQLEADFNTLIDFLLAADCSTFMYRDFQARNIMLPPTNPSDPSSSTTPLYYIDYQGGRRGASQYDVASLLYSAKTDLPQPLRDELLAHYLACRQLAGSQRQQWLAHFRGYLLIRILQTLGAYGYRGLYEHKTHFLQSIPLAVGNLRRLLDDHRNSLPTHMPELLRLLTTLASMPPSQLPGAQISPSPSDQLTVEIGSFSYHQGLPVDNSGNGGGHIFDCRALPNPGRYPEYRAYTGLDQPVIQFLRAQPAVDTFLQHTKAIISQSIEKYLERHFTHLSIYFGCTGGKHRSVYCAEQTAQWLRQTYPCRIVLNHREQSSRQLLENQQNI